MDNDYIKRQSMTEKDIKESTTLAKGGMMSSIDSGWLSPSGELIQCDPYEHFATAEKLAGGKAPDFQADEYLMDHGWVKIYRGSYLDHKWHINWHGFLSEPQKSYLKPIFEDSIIDLYDYCRDDLKKELNN